ncbi:MAG TPA: hypothetical protein VD908_00015 [Cytophagales bacterium]|nr:hypothetical protein [Cytophagales bacterium]
MKKTTFFLPIILLLSFFSCENEEQMKSEENNISAQEIADGHHYLVNLYNDKKLNESKLRTEVYCPECATSNFTNKLEIQKMAMIAKGYNSTEVNTQTAEGKTRLQNLGVLVNNGSTLIPIGSYKSILINDLHNRGRISSFLADDLLRVNLYNSGGSDPIYNTIYAEETIRQIRELRYSLSYSLRYNWIDRQYVDVFIQVAQDSYNNQQAGKLRPGSSTIIADAVGAVWGLSLGPVGSIVYGAAFSLYENEVLAD